MLSFLCVKGTPQLTREGKFHMADWPFYAYLERNKVCEGITDLIGSQPQPVHELPFYNSFIARDVKYGDTRTDRGRIGSHALAAR